MDSWVILDSTRAGEGQKGHQRELSYQSKNPVVKTEQAVSSIALTIRGAKVSHYKMSFSPFCFIQANFKKKGWPAWTIPSQGHATSSTCMPVPAPSVVAWES